MRAQYILISTLIIVSILSYYYIQSFKIRSEYEEPLMDYIKNLENEIAYISKNFNKSYLLKFITAFKTYLESNNIQMNFTCVLFEQNYDPSVMKCGIVNKNCCYILESPKYIRNEFKYCNVSFLFKEKNLVCICYNISKDEKFYVNLICV